MLPSKKDYMQQRMSGLAMADVLLLVVSADPDEIDTTIAEAKQIFACAAGYAVKSVLVAVNFDGQSETWDEEQFNAVKDELTTVLRKFRLPSAGFVPVSSGRSVMLCSGERGDTAPWYDGEVLGGVLDKHLKLWDRPWGKPLRISFSTVRKADGFPGKSVVQFYGRVNYGVLKHGQSLALSNGVRGVAIVVFDYDLQELEHKEGQAEPGDNVFVDFEGLDLADVCPQADHDHCYSPGHAELVASDADEDPIKAVASAKVSVGGTTKEIQQGQTLTCYVAAQRFKCTVEEIAGGQEAIAPGKGGAMTLSIEGDAVYLAPFKELGALGRGVIMNDENDYVSAFAVKEILG